MQPPRGSLAYAHQNISKWCTADSILHEHETSFVDPDSIRRQQARKLFLDAVLQLRADASSLNAARHSAFTSICYF